MFEKKVQSELKLGPQLSIINLVNSVIEHAHQVRASDIHMDPGADGVRVRFRIDGVMQEMYAFPKNIQPEVVTRIKILCGLRTDEHQTAMDGRFRTLTEGETPVDIRVSITPTYYGENAVLRLLSDKAYDFTLKSLGFSEANRSKILAAAKKPYGMILATGPTGSGKTTTLYTLLKTLNQPEVSIITVEDPIEYSISGINQIQVNSRTSLTFANGLRSILRQDPNIIMVGEIRDDETAGIAVNTALTGHLLLSSLHTNDAATTLPRLLDLKIEPYLIASTVNVAIGQRLVRKICESCRMERKITPAERNSLSDSLPGYILPQQTVFFHGAGCEDCNNTGYTGRIGIHEVLVMNSAIREAILNKAAASDIRSIAQENGMVTIVEDGLEKVKKGITTIEEVFRMLHDD